MARSAVFLRLSMQFVIWPVTPVAGNALVAIFSVQLAVGEGSRKPFSRTVALRTTQIHGAVQIVVRFVGFMARNAL